MQDIPSISTGLKLGEDGIWYSQDRHEVLLSLREAMRIALRIEDGSFWFRHRNNCILSVVKSHSPGKYETIFDIGGGNGFVSLGLSRAGFNVALLEPGKTGATNAKRRGLENVICATTSSANLKPGSIGAAGLFDVIEHMEDDLRFLKSIGTLMKKNGRLYATVPAYSFLWSDEDVSAGHFRRYTLASISAVIESAGLRVEFCSYIFRFLPVPIFLLRTLPFKLGLSRALRNAKSAAGEHGTGDSVVSRLMDTIGRREIRHLDNGKAMRFGGSCLVVAKRA